MYNESKNIHDLFLELSKTFNYIQNHFLFEIIVVNDGSNDLSKKILNQLKIPLKFKVINNSKNYGQSYSIHQGIINSKYNTIVTIDGDLQNDSRDIIKLLNLFFNNLDYKLIGGLRKKRIDSSIKIFSSKISNSVRKYILKDNCDDTGCSLKVFDKKIFLNFPFFDGMHRFLPALYNGYGYKTNFIEVNHRARNAGVSKYGISNRLFRGIKDIFRVRKIIKYNRRNK